MPWTIRSAAKEALVAQVTDKKSRICDRCFAPVPALENFCPECGAALTNKGGSDEAVYPELARANLLRMRGDYKAAEDQCLSILRRYPNNETANVLLGDISLERGDFEQAMQWYELALDLNPDDQVAKHKLTQARERFKEKETATTVEQLGLPTTKSKAGVYAIALIASIFAIAVVAYFVGQNVAQRRAASDAGLLKVPISSDGGSSAQPTGGSGVVNSVSGDEALLQAVREKVDEGSRVIGATQDPRSGEITITYTAMENEDARVLGARIARDTFKNLSDAVLITLRALRRGKLIFVADVARSRYEETLMESWKNANGSEEATWVNFVLSREWPAKQVEPTTPTEPTTTSPQQPPGEEPTATHTEGGEAPPQGEPTPPTTTEEAKAEEPKTEEPKTESTGGGQAPPGEGQ